MQTRKQRDKRKAQRAMAVSANLGPTEAERRQSSERAISSHRARCNGERVSQQKGTLTWEEAQAAFEAKRKQRKQGRKQGRKPKVNQSTQPIIEEMTTTFAHDGETMQRTIPMEQ